MNISEQVKESSSQSSSGCWCIFIPLSETEGVKFYHKREIRDEALKLQSHAASVGLGPAVGGVAEMPYLDSWDEVRPRSWSKDEAPSVVYGYITEIVDDDPRFESPEYSEFCAQLEAHEISDRDLECGNIGRTRAGKLVRFDFDPMFYYEEQTAKDYWWDIAKSV